MKRRWVRWVVGIVSGILSVIALVVATALINAAVVDASARASQKERMARLTDLVAQQRGGTFADWTDTSSAGDISDDTPIDRVQTIASHNSYVEAPNPIQNTLIAIGGASRLAPLQYSHPHLWDQLEAGVRSVELDVRVHRDGTLRMTHAPLTANGGNAVDFLLAIEEVTLWSRSHPGHLPITILLEVKNDFTMLDWSLADFDEDEFRRVDEELRRIVGDGLLTPAQLRGNSESARAAVEANGWPTVGDLRGTISIILYPTEQYRATYAQIDERERAIFLAATGEDVLAGRVTDDTVFAVQDVPTPSVLRQLVAQGFLVRTRADTDLLTDPHERDLALASGAQIVSSDFYAPLVQDGTGFTVVFDGGALTRLAPR